MIKRIWTHPMFLIIRMGFVFYIIKAGLYKYYGETFVPLNEIWLTAIFIVAFWVIYCLAVFMDYKRIGSSPFLLSETIMKEISKLIRSCVVLPDRRGLYRSAENQTADGGAQNEYVPVNDPAQLKGKLMAYREMLYTLNNPSADDLIRSVNKLIDEADYMLEAAV